MPFLRSDMLYNDDNYYKWIARVDHDNPYYRNGRDHTLLNRTEGYEILYFINHLGAKHWPGRTSTPLFQQLERMIRMQIPTKLQSPGTLKIGSSSTGTSCKQRKIVSGNELKNITFPLSE